MHAIGLTLNDAQAVAVRGSSMVWAPRSNIVLYGDTADVTLYQNLGINIALGTDWIITGSMNMLREFACADEMNVYHYGGFFTDQQIVQMATITGAKAAHLDNELGSLDAGKWADLAMFSESTNKRLPRHHLGAAARRDARHACRKAALWRCRDPRLPRRHRRHLRSTTSLRRAKTLVHARRKVGSPLATVQSSAISDYDLFLLRYLRQRADLRAGPQSTRRRNGV